MKHCSVIINEQKQFLSSTEVHQTIFLQSTKWKLLLWWIPTCIFFTFSPGSEFQRSSSPVMHKCHKNNVWKRLCLTFRLDTSCCPRGPFGFCSCMHIICVPRRGQRVRGEPFIFKAPYVSRVTNLFVHSLSVRLCLFITYKYNTAIIRLVNLLDYSC